ncbi:MAG: GGDEF domain-containing protein, partial [Methylotenera sp.]|nr:GGDEF domain-containing protein [Methylotenera sp.]MDP1522335.1 GGDEF domain-containing protein [Methylotenera sp.]
MKNLGIKSRVIFLGTIPALLFAIILVGYAVSNIFGVLDQSLQDRGKTIASQLAPAAEYGVISGNSQVLQRLVQQALSYEQDLRTVLLVDNQGMTLALSGRALPKEVIAEIMKDNLQQLQQDKGIIFTYPIYRSLVEIDD